ncbi:prephenate dehydrogenase [Beauveria bassiana ARSEF 2860]|uniref:Prephenate dehydrogenase [NADP(+)] n=1 Tax=Beauveria bassiana (strain ARSEF 2860) TaxID=655819 RepID=J5JPZ4_BEAB2|nr:prephenate dehydrogenase [Beauveria bassiana ARSEF 2860]EJP67158.1 prephenate dehydrogenase [Beauveria bassiana ARSEF 2860]
MAASEEIPAGMENFVVGLIGMGDMGRMYAERLSEAGWRIMACDREDSYDSLKEKYSANEKIEICRNGHLVSRASDYIIYSVEAAVIDSVIASYGPSTKMGAIVGGQTSCKSPEIAAFERHLPADVDIISCHSLHGPGVDPKNQPLVLVQHRAPDASLRKVEAVLRCLQSTFVYLSAREHDRITADTQAVTHAAFLSMGKAWHANRQFPWTMSRYVGGVENVKVNLMLRIYSQKWHVYAGLAILNPEAREQVAQYARSVTDLYKLMLVGDLAGLRARLYAARDKVFGTKAWGGGGGGGGSGGSGTLLIEPSVLSSFALGQPPSDDDPTARRANNHLSLLAMVDCWAELGIVPYDHMLCSTPLFRLRLGVTEYLFRTPALLDEALVTAVEDQTYRSDDLEFTFAARAWAECVSLGHFETWRKRFESTQEFFEPRFAEAKIVGDQMMKKVFESTKP